MGEHVTDSLVIPIEVEQEQIEEAKASMRELRELADEASGAIGNAIDKHTKWETYVDTVLNSPENKRADAICKSCIEIVSTWEKILIAFFSSCIGAVVYALASSLL